MLNSSGHRAGKILPAAAVILAGLIATEAAAAPVNRCSIWCGMPFNKRSIQCVNLRCECHCINELHAPVCRCLGR